MAKMKYPRIVDGLLVQQVTSKYGTIKHDKGYGIFAMRDYRKGERICTFVGKRIKDTDPRLTHRGVQVGPRLFIEPARFSNAWYMNHSCEANAYVDMEHLYARRAIKKGEEITSDYSLFTDYEHWDMECGCKTQSCRGVVLPYSKLKKKPKKHISSYLRK